MHAQVTTVEASPVRLDDAIRFFREQVLPRFRQMDGFEEFIVLSARCGPLGERRSGCTGTQAAACQQSSRCAALIDRFGAPILPPLALFTRVRGR